MSNTKGVLLLSHVGFSFMENLVGAVSARGLNSYVLSSLPEPHQQQSRPAALAELADEVRITDEHVLTPRDVEDHLRHLQTTGIAVLCCLSVWEGYRHLMALANARLGVPDLDEKQVLALRDKLTTRNALAGAGLTRSRAALLTPSTLAERQGDGERHFVKPVSGIASFGTFPLTDGTTWADLERISDEARTDTVYASAFTADADASASASDHMAFLIEDYVPGSEFSFEVIAVDGHPHVVAVHEKCEVTETTGTVLENACVSPPTSLTRQEVSAGLDWLTSVLDALDLRWGCFHVEARHARTGWDLIEVNPRVGGSLISPSVAAQTGGRSMLDLWLDALLDGRAPEKLSVSLAQLSFGADGVPASPTATFFRVFFAEPGTISSVQVADNLPLPPVVSQVFLGPGDVIESASREVFLGQVLWSMARVDRDAILPELLAASEHAVKVVYETEPAP